MNFQFTSGILRYATITIIYGVEGVGKTTLLSKIKNLVLIDTENGSKFVDVKRIHPHDYEETCRVLVYIKENKICKTIAIDTIDALEQMMIEYLCVQKGKESIEDFGYGKGYVYLKEIFNDFLKKFIYPLLEEGINVVFTGHAQVKKMEMPEDMSSYDRYELKLSKHVSAFVKAQCDNLIFCNFKSETVRLDSGKVKQIGNKRMMYCEHSAVFDAKNRSGLPAECEMSADVLNDMLNDAQPVPTSETSAIHAITSKLDDDVEVEIIDEDLPFIDNRSQLADDLIKKCQDENVNRGDLEQYVWHYWDNYKGKHLEEFDEKMLSDCLRNFKKIKEAI